MTHILSVWFRPIQTNEYISGSRYLSGSLNFKENVFSPPGITRTCRDSVESLSFLDNSQTKRFANPSASTTNMFINQKEFFPNHDYSSFLSTKHFPLMSTQAIHQSPVSLSVTLPKDAHGFSGIASSPETASHTVPLEYKYTGLMDEDDTRDETKRSDSEVRKSYNSQKNISRDGSDISMETKQETLEEISAQASSSHCCEALSEEVAQEPVRLKLSEKTNQEYDLESGALDNQNSCHESPDRVISKPLRSLFSHSTCSVEPVSSDSGNPLSRIPNHPKSLEKRHSRQSKASNVTEQKSTPSISSNKSRTRYHNKRVNRQARGSLHRLGSQDFPKYTHECLPQDSYNSNTSRFELLPLPNVVEPVAMRPDYSLLSNQLEHPFTEVTASLLSTETASCEQYYTRSISLDKSPVAHSLQMDALKLIAETLDISLKEVQSLIASQSELPIQLNANDLPLDVVSKNTSELSQHTLDCEEDRVYQAVSIQNGEHPSSETNLTRSQTFHQESNEKNIFTNEVSSDGHVLNSEHLHPDPIKSFLSDLPALQCRKGQLKYKTMSLVAPENNIQIPCLNEKSSGVPTQLRSMKGVSFDRSKRNWEASWLDAQTGKRVKKCFSEGRWGSSARDMAILARKKAEVSGIISTRQQLHNTHFLVAPETLDVKMASSCIALGKPAQSESPTPHTTETLCTGKLIEKVTSLEDDQNDILLQRIAQHVKNLLPQKDLSKSTFSNASKCPLINSPHERLLRPFPSSYELTTSRSSC